MRDGNSGRWTYEAIYLLPVGRIDIRLLPSHCIPYPITVRQFDRGPLYSLGEKRCWLIEAFLNAWDQAASRKNVLSEFKICDIAPLNREIPLVTNDKLEFMKAKSNEDFARDEEKLRVEDHEARAVLIRFSCAILARSMQLNWGYQIPSSARVMFANFAAYPPRSCGQLSVD
jgi:hypothetical protein